MSNNKFKFEYLKYVVITAFYTVLAWLVFNEASQGQPWWPITIMVLPIGAGLVCWMFWIKDNKQNAQAFKNVQQAEQMYKSMALACNDLMFDWHIDSNVINWQVSRASQWGYVDNVLADNLDAWKTRVHPDDLAQVEAALQALIDSDRIRWTGEYRFSRNDGNYVWVLEQAIVRRNESKQALQMIRGIKDINEKMETMASQKQIMQRQKVAALSRLSDGAAHDYNNILGVISGYAELMGVQYAQDPKLQKYLKEIHLAVDRAEVLGKKLLDYSRRQRTGQAQIRFEQVVLPLLEGFKLTLPETIEIDWHLVQCSQFVRLDSVALEAAIFNLGDNAVAAMPQGGKLRFVSEIKSLTVQQCEQLQLEGGGQGAQYLVFSVIDNGCGIESQIQNQMFDPYFSGSKRMGMGLSQVYGFIHSCNGTVVVDSAPGKGSRIMLYFPLI